MRKKKGRGERKGGEKRRNGSYKGAVKKKREEVKDTKRVLHKHKVRLRERSACRRLWWGLSSHMVMQGHVCCDVFDMCWAHTAVVWLQAAVLQQEQPAADLPCVGGHHSFVQCTELAQRRCATDVQRQESICSSFT